MPYYEQPQLQQSDHGKLADLLQCRMMTFLHSNDLAHPFAIACSRWMVLASDARTVS